MKDLQIKGTGNSRYLKSAIGSAATWEEARAMLINGTFPIDFAGINEAGILQMGDALNKANLLTDETAALLGGDSTMVPDDAFTVLKNLVDTASALAEKNNAKIETGTYTATNIATKSITFSFVPKVVFILGPYGAFTVIPCTLLTSTNKDFGYLQRRRSNDEDRGFYCTTSMKAKIVGTTVTVTGPYSDYVPNESNYTYSYFAFA